MRKEFGFLFWVHLAIIFFSFLTPIFFDWKIVILIELLINFQYLVYGGCLLTHMELGKGEVFFHHYLSKIFPRVSKRAMSIAGGAGLSAFIIGMAAFVQLVYGWEPLLIDF